MRTEKHIYTGECDDCGKTYEVEFPRETNEHNSLPDGWKIFDIGLSVYGKEYYSDDFKYSLTFCAECSDQRKPPKSAVDQNRKEHKPKVIALLKKIKFDPSKWVRRNFDY